MLFVTGASGSGKSSFVKAGLLPRLREHYTKRHKQTPYAIFRLGDQTMKNLDDALSQLAPNFSRDLAAFTPLHQVNLLVIDQFEEVFTQAHLAADAEFLQWLQQAPPFAQGRTHIMVTVRSDYLNELFNLERLYDLNRYGLNLRAMTIDELSQAIQRPVQVHFPKGEKRFEPALVQRLAEEASVQSSLLPLLQVTLQELWKKGALKVAAYATLTDAIQRRADEVHNFQVGEDHAPGEPRSAQDKQALMDILLDLINVAADGADHRDARQRRTRQELGQGSAHRPRLIEELVNARLLAAASETRNGEEVEVIDIIHESLIDNWDRLRGVIEEQRQQLQRRARFKLWLGEWVRNGKQDGALLTDLQLAEAQALAAQHDIELQNREAQDFYTRSWQYLEENRQRELENQKQRARIFRNAVIISSLLLLIALGLAEWGRRSSRIASNNAKTATVALATSAASVIEVGKARDDAMQQAEIAKTREAEAKIAQANAEQQAAIARSRQLAAQSISELSKNRYELAILLAITSGRSADTFEAFSAIRAAIANPWHSRVTLYGHTDTINQATWSQDESKILTCSDDKTVRIWDAATGIELIKLEGHTDTVVQATWSHDGNKILTSSFDNTIRIWDAATGAELLKLDGHMGSVIQATWNQDESKILTSSNDSTIRIWDAATGAKLLKLEGPMGSLSQGVWSQDESKILSSWGNTARIWDAATGAELLKLDGHMDFIWQATWSHDENKILTHSFDKTVRIWDAATGQELVKLEGHTDSVDHATWSQDESKILTHSRDKTTRIWDAATGKELLKLEGHTNTVDPATWSQDGNRILTSSFDETARIRDATTGKELIKLEGHTRNIWQANWSQDESKILTSSLDNTVRIWDAATGKELLKLEGHTDHIDQATWSQDESKILTRSDDNTVRIWDVAIGQELLKLEGVNRATWSQDESKILTSSDYSTVRIWDTATGKELLKFEGHRGTVHQATWSQDESKILTSSIDDTARIWNAATGKELVRFEGHTDSVNHATWSRDENKILTNSRDKTARIWDAATGKELIKLEGHTHNVDQATWSQDENKILTSSWDNTARMWDAATGKELLKLEGHAGYVEYAIWSQNESKILTSSSDNTARMWDAATGKELLKFEGHTRSVNQAIWSRDESKILTSSIDNTARIWDAATGQELLKLEGHTDGVWQAIWSQDESKILTHSYDKTIRIWDAATGKELLRLEGHTDTVHQATWSQDGNKILTGSFDNTVRIWSTRMSDLLVAACKWTPRNFTWSEWNIYMQETQGAYGPTCPNAPIPPDAIAGIQEEARQQILAGQVLSGMQRLEELNGWLQANGQFKNYGVDVPAFVAEVSATATAEAMPTSIVTPELSATSTSSAP